MTVVLITGGARSGKSRRAELRTLSFPGRAIYIATSEALDPEMEARIAHHRERRGAHWDLKEEPLDLVKVLTETDGRGPRLIDCLTLWLSNLMHAEQDWRFEASKLCEALVEQAAPVVLVTNEVGLGIVPDNALARRFRDAAGFINQAIAEVADEVEFVTCGIPLKLK